MRYLLDHKLADAHLTRLLKDSLRDGYARLAQFECPQGGFGTFAGDRSDPVLTALALSSFHELATVYDLDPAIVRRTAQQLRPGGQASAPADEPAADAYVAWRYRNADSLKSKPRSRRRSHWASSRTIPTSWPWPVQRP